MSSSQALQLPMQLSFSRNMTLAVELLDAVTLERVNQGISIIAEGFRSRPVQNASGIFVWFREDLSQLQSITINTGRLPLEDAVLPASAVKHPLTTIELPPRLDYPFNSGVTGIRGSLVESSASGNQPEPIASAKIYLSWLDENGAWKNSTVISSTDSGGDFVSVLRFSSSQKPMLDAQGSITVRVNAAREGWNTRQSSVRTIALSRITNPTIVEPLVFFWDELTP